MGGTKFYDQDRGTSLSATVPACPPTAAPFTSGSSRRSASNWVEQRLHLHGDVIGNSGLRRSPARHPASTLTSSTTTFTWNTGTGVSQYWLSVGSTVGGTQFYDQDRGTSLSATVSGLPTNGSTVYVRLKSKIGTNWVNSDYTYTATSVSTPAQITSPTPGSTSHLVDDDIYVEHGHRRLPVLAVCRDHPGRQSALRPGPGNKSISNRNRSSNQWKHHSRKALVEDRGELAVHRLHLQSEADAVENTSRSFNRNSGRKGYIRKSITR